MDDTREPMTLTELVAGGITALLVGYCVAKAAFELFSTAQPNAPQLPGSDEAEMCCPKIYADEGDVIVCPHGRVWYLQPASWYEVSAEEGARIQLSDLEDEIRTMAE